MGKIRHRLSMANSEKAERRYKGSRQEVQA